MSTSSPAERIDGETGTCQKCSSTISVEATRCPECGYEPSTGIGKSILSVLALGGLLFFGLIALSSLLLLTNGNFLGAIGVFVLFGSGAGISGFVLYALSRQSERIPVNDELDLFGGDS